MKLDAVLTPAEIAALTPRRLRGVTCVVIDVLRATSSMITALANGAEAIIPVASIEEAQKLRRKNSKILLAGERNGFKIAGFDLGNSPREMTPRKTRGKLLACTTTNGTVALRACRSADAVYVLSLLNLPATARALAEIRGKIMFVCSGTIERMAEEDVFCAGAAIAALVEGGIKAKLSAAAKTALAEYHRFRGNARAALRASRNGRRLRGIRLMAGDVDYCTQIGRYNFLAQCVGGRVVATSSVER